MPAPTVAASEVNNAAYSYSTTFAPQTNTDRALVVFTGSSDRNQNERNNITASYDNTSFTDDNGHDYANDGSFPWSAVNADGHSDDDTALDVKASSANLSIQSCGAESAIFIVDLADVNDGTPDATDTASGSGTSSTVTVATTLVGNVALTHTWTGAENYAHIAVAWEGTDATHVIVVDMLIVWGGPTITVDANATLLHSDSVTTGDHQYYAVCTYQVVSGSSDQQVAAGLATEDDAAEAVTFIGDQTSLPGTATEDDAAQGVTISSGGGGGSGFGEIGHWTDSGGSQIPGTTYAAMEFAAETRNDGIYTQVSNTTFELDTPGHYRITARLYLEDTSNGRYNPQAQVVLTSGTADVVFTTRATGYSRDTSEDTAGVEVEAYIVNASENAQFQLQWRRDTDAPTGGSVVNASSLQVIHYDHSAVGVYSLTTANQALGGTTPNVVGLTADFQSDTAAIEISGGNLITCKTSGRLYEVIGFIAGDTGGARTQRIVQVDYTAGGPTGEPRGVAYHRSATNEYAGALITDLLEHGGTNITFELEVFRGPGVANGDGGADVDGSWVSDTGGVCVIELPDGVEGGRWYDGTALQTISGTTDVDLNIARTTSHEDTASFSRDSNTQVEAVVTMDAMVQTNAFAAANDVSAGSRYTGIHSITINGTKQTLGVAVDYSRGNQGTTSTFGWSGHAGAVYELLAADLIGSSAVRIAGGEAGQTNQTQPGTVIMYAINLDSFPGGGGGSQLLSVGRALEDDEALGLTVAGAVSVAVGTATEEDAAQAVTLVQPGTVIGTGIALEDDEALGPVLVAGAVTVPINVATEDDEALGVTPAAGAVALPVGLSAELDAALTHILVLGVIALALNRALEDDTALPVTFAGATTVAAGVATEDDEALPLTISTGTVVAAGVATEDDESLTVTPVAGAVTVAAGAALEDDTANALTLVPGVATVQPGTATENDEALPLTVATGTVVATGIATEDDESLTVTPVAGAVTVAAGAALEDDEALATTINTGTIVAIGRALEDDEALPATLAAGAVTVAAGIATEDDESLPVTLAAGATTVAVGRALEDDEALPVTFAGATTVAVGHALEDDESLGPVAIVGAVSVATGAATEDDEALPMTLAAGAVTVAVGRALEDDEAPPVTIITDGAIGVQVAFEEDEALPVTSSTGPVTVAAGAATEDDAALGATVNTATTIGAGAALEDDEALLLSVVSAQQVATATALEDDESLGPVVVVGAVTVATGAATEDDAALGATPIAGLTTVAINVALEDDTALPITAAAGLVAVPVQVALEEDDARPVAVTSIVAVSVGPATEDDDAGTMTVVNDEFLPLGVAAELDNATMARVLSTALAQLSEVDTMRIANLIVAWEHKDEDDPRVPPSQFQSDIDVGRLRLFNDAERIGMFPVLPATTRSLTIDTGRALILLSDKPFDLQLVATETWLTNLRVFVLWSDDSAAGQSFVVPQVRNQGTEDVRIELFLLSESA